MDGFGHALAALLGAMLFWAALAVAGIFFGAGFLTAWIIYT